MSLRTEVRRNRYNLHKVYKFKKGDDLLKKLLKKRHQQSSAKLKNVPCMVAGLNSNDNNKQLEATTQLCELLAIEPNPIDQVVQSRVLPRLVEFLTRDDFPQLQFEAAGALTKVASGTSHETKVVIDHGAVSIFVKLLDSSPSDDVRQQAVWALGNIAADSPGCRDLVLGQGALIPLLFQLNEGANLSMLRKATWTLSQFCKGNPQPQFDEQMKAVLPALKCLLLHSKDEEVLTNACWALAYLSNEHIQAVIDFGICNCLVEFLNHPSPSVLFPALLPIRNIIMRDDHIELQDMIETGLIAPLVKLLQTAEDECIIKEAVWTIAYAASYATNKQIKYLVNQGCINPLCDLLDRSSFRILIFSLQILDEILETGKATGELNIYKVLIQDAEGFERIKYLQRVDSQVIVKRAVKILETYWLEDFQKCDKVEPGQIMCT